MSAQTENHQIDNVIFYFLINEHLQVADKLVKCWCSNYRREVLNYRKMHGQILVPSMAVVIQQMVTDGVAGELQCLTVSS